MTAAKVMDVIARLPDCDGQAADAIERTLKIASPMVAWLVAIFQLGEGSSSWVDQDHVHGLFEGTSP